MREYIVPIADNERNDDEMFIGTIRKREELVRCGECIHLTNDRICPRWERICELTGGGKAENGYCDEGERSADDEAD